jgi:calcineurin-like phosphoesterase family protein
VLLALALAGVGLTACDPGDPTMVFAGDIACSSAPQTSGTSCRYGTGTTGTAGLVTWLNPDHVGAVGDLQYDTGALADYNARYDPTWGTFRAKTYPVPGNHEYDSPNGVGYYDYWSARAGTRGKGWYAKNVGKWLILALNSEVPVATSSEQYNWLKAVLDFNHASSNPQSCILAFWHKPRWSSDTVHGSSASYGAFWSLLRAHHADIVVNGHAHVYERFDKQNASGVADAGGIRQFTSGTGGKSLYGFGTPLANSQVRITAPGVLRLQFHANSYDWAWHDLARTVQDSGTTTCNAGS